MLSDLSQKELVMIVGPAAIGKSTLMKRAVELDDSFGAVSGFTSRPPRSNDETGRYRYIGGDDIEAVIDSPDTIQYAVHPTTGFVYGTQLQDYSAQYNLLDALASVADQLRALPFRKTTIISLTAPSIHWQEWFFARYPSASAERRKRLEEAVQSIQWSLNQTEHPWLVNHQSDVDSVATNLIYIVKNGTPTAQVNGRQVAEDLLTTIQTLLSYEQKESYGQANPTKLPK